MQAQADGTKANQLMADATGHLRAVQMNDISEMMYHNESYAINQMIDKATEVLPEKLNLSNILRQLVVKKFLLPLKMRLMQWFQIFPHQNQSIIRI